MEWSRRMIRRIAGLLSARVSDLDFGQVEDPRRRQGRRWALPQLMQAALMGLMAGCRNLAQTEALTAEMTRAMRRLLQIPRRIADTTLRDALCHIDPDEIRRSLHAQIRAAWRRKALRPEKFPFGVVACDGKATAIGFWDQKWAQLSANERTKKAHGLLRTVSCALVTAKGTPCIDAVPIPPSTNEMGHFPKVFGGLVETYDKLFRLVTYDAGAASEANARLVVDEGKDYLFRLKDERRQMYQLATLLLGERTEPLAITEDVLSNVKFVVRKVYVADVSSDEPDGLCWVHAKTMVRVRSETFERGELVASEDRYYVSSLAMSELSFAQWLRLVRMHWRVENDCHNTFDRILREDDHPWIELNPQGALVVMLLRRVAYNMLTLFRSVTQRSDERRAMPWKDLIRSIYNTMIAATDNDINGLRIRKPAPASS